MVCRPLEEVTTTKECAAICLALAMARGALYGVLQGDLDGVQISWISLPLRLSLGLWAARRESVASSAFKQRNANLGCNQPPKSWGHRQNRSSASDLVISNAPRWPTSQD